MTKKGNLFYLIKSLTKSEKRYFKIFCFSEKTSKNYLQLFKTYEKMEELDEDWIKKKFAKIKQLHVTKNYLNNLILSSLRSYHASLSKDAELKDCLRNIEILFHKELLDQCFYEIQKAEKLATSYELMTGLVEVLSWKRRYQLTRFGLQKNNLTELIKEEKSTLEKLARLNEYWYLMTQVFNFSNDSKQLFLQKEAIQTPEKYGSLSSKILYYHLLYSYHTINRRPIEGKQAIIELIHFLEQDPEQIKNNPSPYITALNNLIGFYLHQKNYDAAFPLLYKIKQVSEKYQLKSGTKFNIKLQLRSYNIELEIYRDIKNWQKGRDLIKEIEIFMKNNHKIISDLYFLLLWYQFAYIYFMSKDFGNALKWVNEIINRKFEASRKDMESYARLLNLMIHFELGNSFVLKYSVESCRRWMKKQQKIQPFEQVILKFFSKISNAPKGDYSLHFQQLEIALFDKKLPLIDANILDYLDIKEWIERHLRLP